MNKRKKASLYDDDYCQYWSAEMDWDATTPNFRDANHYWPNEVDNPFGELGRSGRPLWEAYLCKMRPGVYKDNTPWFNGLSWSHEGGPAGGDYRWEILGDPSATAGRNGNYSMLLGGHIMPRNHWYEDAVEHYDMFGPPSDFAMFSGVIIRDGVMKMYYYGEEVYVGPMAVYRNNDIYRIPRSDRGPVRYNEEASLRNRFQTLQFPWELEYQFKKIYVNVPGMGDRVFGVGRLVDVLPDKAGGYFGTHHLTLNTKGEIQEAGGGKYPVNNRVSGSADMRRIWCKSGPAQDFNGYWTIHEYRNKTFMDGPKWENNGDQMRQQWFRDNMDLWSKATTSGQDPDETSRLMVPKRESVDIYKSVNPRLIEEDFDRDCKNCTPNPEDI